MSCGSNSLLLPQTVQEGPEGTTEMPRPSARHGATAPLNHEAPATPCPTALFRCCWSSSRSLAHRTVTRATVSVPQFPQSMQWEKRPLPSTQRTHRWEMLPVGCPRDPDQLSATDSKPGGMVQALAGRHDTPSPMTPKWLYPLTLCSLNRVLWAAFPEPI